MSKLIPDIFALIINQLKDERGTLFNCLLVNKLWCEITIPILWEGCLKRYLKSKCLVSLIKVLFAFLSEESKHLLIMNEINLSFIQTQRPLFDYFSYCKSIVVTFDVIRVIEICYKSPLSENQEKIIEKSFYDLIFDKCSYLVHLRISYTLRYGEQFMVNFMKLEDNLSNLVELSCTQSLDERIFYNLAKICVNIKKLELEDRNNNIQGLVKLIEVQRKLEYFIYSGQEGQNWDNFCEMIGQALIKHKNTLKHIHGKFLLCIPLNILGFFVNLEGIILGHYTKNTNDLRLVRFPKLRSLDVSYPTGVKELIQNTSGDLKIVDINNPFAENIEDDIDDIIQIVIAIYQNCPKLEDLYITFFDTIVDALGDLLVHCNQLEFIQICSKYPFNVPTNGDVVLKILSKSTSKKLERIEMFGSWKFSVESMKEFLNNWKERKYPLYFKFDTNIGWLNEEFSSMIQNFVDDNVLRFNPLNNQFYFSRFQ